MPEINPSKNDRVGDDLHEDPQPNPDGKTDTSDTLVPPLSEPSTTSAAHLRGPQPRRQRKARRPERMMSVEPSPEEAT